MKAKRLIERLSNLNEASSFVNADIFEYGSRWHLEMVIENKYGTKTKHKLSFATAKEALDKLIKTVDSLPDTGYGEIKFNHKLKNINDIKKQIGEGFKESLSENSKFDKCLNDMKAKRFIEKFEKLLGLKEKLLDGMEVDGPLVDIYTNPSKVASMFYISDEQVRNTIKDIIGNTPHSSGAKRRLKELEKEVKSDISKLSGDAKYLKRDKVDMGDRLDSEKELELVKYLLNILKSKDGTSKEAENSYNIVMLFDVLKGFESVSDLLDKGIGNKTLSKKFADSAEKLRILYGSADKYMATESDIVKTLKPLDVNTLVKELASEFKKFDSSGHVVKIGRREVSLVEVIQTLTDNFKKFVADIRKQGFDISKVQ